MAETEISALARCLNPLSSPRSWGSWPRTLDHLRRQPLGSFRDTEWSVFVTHAGDFPLTIQRYYVASSKAQFADCTRGRRPPNTGLVGWSFLSV